MVAAAIERDMPSEISQSHKLSDRIHDLQKTLGTNMIDVDGSTYRFQNGGEKVKLIIESLIPEDGFDYTYTTQFSAIENPDGELVSPSSEVHVTNAFRAGTFSPSNSDIPGQMKSIISFLEVHARSITPDAA